MFLDSSALIYESRTNRRLLTNVAIKTDAREHVPPLNIHLSEAFSPADVERRRFDLLATTAKKTENVDFGEKRRRLLKKKR